MTYQSFFKSFKQYVQLPTVFLFLYFCTSSAAAEFTLSFQGSHCFLQEMHFVVDS